MYVCMCDRHVCICVCGVIGMYVYMCVYGLRGDEVQEMANLEHSQMLCVYVCMYVCTYQVQEMENLEHSQCYVCMYVCMYL